MLKSMTGFGRADFSHDKRNIYLEIKSVNSRYLDTNIKISKRYSFAEEKILSIIKDNIKRGKVEISAHVDASQVDELDVKVNELLAKQYQQGLEKLKVDLSLEGDIEVELISTFPDVIKTSPKIEDEEKLISSIETVTKSAIETFDEMRTLEGNSLAEDIVERAKELRKMAVKVKELSAKLPEKNKEKIVQRIDELLDSKVEISEDRILLEAAIFADKASVTEEIVRMNSHIKQLLDIIENSNEPQGKKLDFIVQEMNREANTIGSKANDLEITKIVIDMKSEIEKIREQVQNVE
ncbi:MAG: YicC/YloC family endoribonuclease [Anaerovoracaceae bacterium]